MKKRLQDMAELEILIQKDNKEDVITFLNNNDCAFCLAVGICFNCTGTMVRNCRAIKNGNIIPPFQKIIVLVDKTT